MWRWVIERSRMEERSGAYLGVAEERHVLNILLILLATAALPVIHFNTREKERKRNKKKRDKTDRDTEERDDKVTE